MSLRSLDWAIAELAARQHGVIARRQLLELGLGGRAIDYQVGAGRLHPLYRGVYSVGHPRPVGRARWMAAALAYGPDALLSHASAAALYGLRPTARSHIDVTVPGRRGRGRPGVVLHRVRSIQDEDRAIRERIPSPRSRARCSTSQKYFRRGSSKRSSRRPTVCACLT